MKRIFLLTAAVSLGIACAHFGKPRSSQQITAASPSYDDVKAAVDRAASGDTIVIPAGSSTWNKTLTVNKWLTFKGAGKEDTIIKVMVENQGGSGTGAGLVLEGNGYNQITGIQFKGGGGWTAFPAVTCWSGQAVHVWDCSFVNCRQGLRILGPFGVIERNRFENCRGAMQVLGWGNGQENWDRYYPISFTSTNYLFFEDNVVVGDGGIRNNFGDTSFVVLSSGQGSSYVARYNDVTLDGDASLQPAFDWHGDSHDGTRGNLSSQVYSNKFTIKGSASIGRFVAARGGQSLIYGNTITAPAEWQYGWGIGVSEEWPEGSPVNGVTVWDYVVNQWQWGNTMNGVGMTSWCESGSSAPSGCGMLDFHNAAYTGNYKQPYPHPLSSGGGSPLPAAPGSIRLFGTMAGLKETDGSATIVLLREGGKDGVVGVEYGTGDGSAKAGVNYTAVSGRVEWVDKDASNKEVNIPILNAGFYGTNDFRIGIWGPMGGASLGAITNTVVYVVGSATTPPTNAVPVTNIVGVVGVSTNATINGTNRVMIQSQPGAGPVKVEVVIPGQGGKQ